MKKTVLFIALTLSISGVNAQSMSTTNLPIIVINTVAGDGEIPDDPKMVASMGIIYNGPGMPNSATDPFNHYDGPIGIETRGNSTQDFEKKTYSIELRNPVDGSDSSAALLGMPKEEDWILHAMVIDKSQLRIPMSFYLAQRMGHYASRWVYCELFLDGEYRGLYILTERIKRDKNRVDIAKLKSTDIVGDELSGGYILRIDWIDDDAQGIETNKPSLEGVPLFLQYYYPRAENIQPEQSAYILNYINEFQDALWSPTYHNSLGKHYSRYIDMTAFADFLIINEISKNSDGYKLSSYIHKDKTSNGGKLKAGPIWDFDQTYGVSTVCDCNDFEGWTYMQGGGCEDFESMPLWWSKLMDDPVFTNHLKCRWETLRAGPLHTDTLFNWIDDQRLYIQEAVDRNFLRWNDFIGEPIWYEPSPIPSTYDGEIVYMKAWIMNRMNWLDANMPGDCSLDMVGLEEEDQIEISVFPNPSNGLFTIQFPNDRVEIRVFNLQGAMLLEDQLVYGTGNIDLREFSAGQYLLQIQSDTWVKTESLIINN